MSEERRRGAQIGLPKHQLSEPPTSILLCVPSVTLSGALILSARLEAGELTIGAGAGALVVCCWVWTAVESEVVLYDRTVLAFGIARTSRNDFDSTCRSAGCSACNCPTTRLPSANSTT